MIRLLATLTLSLLANAVGLIVASLLLDGFELSGTAFIIAVIIYTLTYVILDPLITKISLRSIPALRGGVALVTTFVGLVITSLLSDGISINGVSTWIIATLIVWLFGLLASVVLPLFLFKKTLAKRND